MFDGRDLDAADRWVDDWQSGIERQAEQAQALAARLAEVGGSARSGDGLIEVALDAAGAVTDLRLADGIRLRSAERTAREILKTIAAARAALAEQAAVVVAETVGVESATGQAVLASFRRSLPGESGGERG